MLQLQKYQAQILFTQPTSSEKVGRFSPKRLNTPAFSFPQGGEELTYSFRWYSKNHNRTTAGIAWSYAHRARVVIPTRSLCAYCDLAAPATLHFKWTGYPRNSGSGGSTGWPDNVGKDKKARRRIGRSVRAEQRPRKVSVLNSVLARAQLEWRIASSP